MATAIKQVEQGYIKPTADLKQGNNVVEYQTPTGKWKEKVIIIK